MISTLYCNKIHHNNNPILFVCMKQNCLNHPACCETCLQTFHQNHNISDFINFQQFEQIRHQQNSVIYVLIDILDQINQATSLLQKKIVNNLNNFQSQNQIEFLNLTQLQEVVQRLKNEKYNSEIKLLTNFYQQANQKIVDQYVDILEKTTQFLLYKPQPPPTIDLINFKYEPVIQKKFKEGSIFFALAISSDNKRLAVSSLSSVELFSIPEFQLLKSWSLPNSNNKFSFDSNFIQDIIFIKNDTFLAGAEWKNKNSPSPCQIILLDLQTFKKHSLIGHTMNIYCLAELLDEKQLISTSLDNQLIIWDLEKFQPIRKTDLELTFTGISISKSLSLIAFCSSSNKAILYQYQNLAQDGLHQLSKWDMHKDRTNINDFNSILLISQNNQVLTCTPTKLQIWSLDVLLQNTQITPLLIYELIEPLNNLRIVDNFPNLLICCDKKNIKFFNLENGNYPEVIPNAGFKMAITNDLQLIISNKGKFYRIKQRQQKI